MEEETLKGEEDKINEIQKLLEKADQFKSLPDTVSVENCYRNILRIDPKNLQALLGLGRVCCEDGRNEESHNFFVRAYEESPNNPDVLYNLANSFRLKGEFELAIVRYLMCLNVDPNYHKAKYDLASIYDKLGNKEEALKYYKMYIESGVSGEIHYEIARSRIVELSGGDYYQSLKLTNERKIWLTDIIDMYFREYEKTTIIANGSKTAKNIQAIFLDEKTKKRQLLDVLNFIKVREKLNNEESMFVYYRLQFLFSKYDILGDKSVV